MRLMMGAALLALTGCGAGSLSWEREVDENGFSITPDMPLVAGSSGQIAFNPLVEGAYADTYEFSASSSDPAIITPTLSLTSGEVEADVPFEVVLSVVVADTATAEDSDYVSVSATRPNGDLAQTSVYVQIVD